MKANLNHICAFLNFVDKTPERAVSFMGFASKYQDFLGVVRESVVLYDSAFLRSEHDLGNKMKDILNILEQNWDKHAWSLHDVHFHTNIEQFIQCPYTSASELHEVITKIINTNFAA